jgi:disease resistance protein RPM1
VYQKLELQSTKNTIPGVDSILKVSLEDLPYELENCFLHCALFPEDYELRRRRLIKHWITSGFVNEKENNTQEEVAEGYLNDLINRSLLQVVVKNEFGRVKKCRLHDVIHHLALKKAETECFGEVFVGSRTFSVCNSRRLSIQSSNISSLSQSGATHLRTIYAFASSIDIELLRPILASSNLLSALDLQGTQIKMLPDEVFNLFNLRFLGLRFTAIEVLPDTIGRLKNLEVLDAITTSLQSLPNGVEKLKKLRFLYAGAVVGEWPLTNFSGIRLPRGIRNLTSLHVLQEVKASIETLHDVATLTELRTFSVCNVLSEHASSLCSAITNMGHLTKLSIDASNENEVLPLEALSLPETLTKLVLLGQLENNLLPRILSSWSHLNNLKKLLLRFSKLDEDSFSSLKVLHGLQCLVLHKAYNGKTMYFPSQAFPRLRVLRILGAPQINQIIIEEGALASLVELRLSDCQKLECLPQGIEYLRTLDLLYLEDTAEELVEKLRDECKENPWNKELQTIIHIRRVVVGLTMKNIWQRIC